MTLNKSLPAICFAVGLIFITFSILNLTVISAPTTPPVNTGPRLSNMKGSIAGSLIEVKDAVFEFVESDLGNAKLFAGETLDKKVKGSNNDTSFLGNVFQSFKEVKLFGEF